MKDTDIDGLLKEMANSLNIKSLPEESQEEIMAELGKNMFQRIVVLSYKKLLPDDAKKLDLLSEDGDLAEICSFLESKIPDFNEFTGKIAGDIIGEFKG